MDCPPLMRLAVVGKGSAGSLAAAHLRAKFPMAELDWYFDEDKPTQAVGEGSTLALPFNLANDIGFNFTHLSQFDGNMKTAIYKQGWGTSNADFFHTFAPPYSAFHFNAKGLQSYVYDRLKDTLNTYEGSVSHKNIDADYIVDCSGSPETLDDYIEAQYIPVNAVKVLQCPWSSPTFNYTLAFARPHGWVFAIPLANRCSIGYLYNTNINSIDDINEDLEIVLQEIQFKYGVTSPAADNSFSFKNYYRQLNFNGNVAYNGNASFFLEPLEATSIDLICVLNNMIVEYIHSGASATHLNYRYSQEVLQREVVIMLHYFAGSIYDSEFWKYAKHRGELCIKNALGYSRDFANAINQSLGYFTSFDYENTKEYYGSWPSASFEQNILGLGIKDTLSELVKPYRV